MSQSLKSKFALAGMVLAGMASPLGAIALSVNQFNAVPSRVVEFADLDLNRKAGIAVLYSRIKSAAREVCEPVDYWSTKLLQKTYECRQDAVARAVEDVHSTSLTDYYAQRVTASGELTRRP